MNEKVSLTSLNILTLKYSIRKSLNIVFYIFNVEIMILEKFLHVIEKVQFTFIFKEMIKLRDF